MIARRVERTQQILRKDDELSLAEVALRVGFSDQSRDDMSMQKFRPRFARQRGGARRWETICTDMGVVLWLQHSNIGEKDDCRSLNAPQNDASGVGV